MWQEEFILGEALQLFTDAAGSVGCGAYFNKHWSNGRWPLDWFISGHTKNIVLL